MNGLSENGSSTGRGKAVWAASPPDREGIMLQRIQAVGPDRKPFFLRPVLLSDRHYALLAGFILVFGCGTTDHERTDVGAVCVYPGECVNGGPPADGWEEAETGITGAFEEFGKICVTVSLYVSGVVDDTEAECHILVLGTDIQIHSEFRYTTENSDFELFSTMETGSLLTACCESPALPAGDYVIKHGAREKHLTVPGVEYMQELCDE